MKNKAILAAMAAALVAQTARPETVTAHRHDRYDQPDRHDKHDPYDRNDRRWRGDRNEGWDPSRHYDNKRYKKRRLGRNDRIYRGSDGRYYCKRDNGTTGLVVGALAGGVLGNVIGGNTLGTLLGAGGGALLGRQIDRGDVKCR